MSLPSCTPCTIGLRLLVGNLDSRLQYGYLVVQRCLINNSQSTVLDERRDEHRTNERSYDQYVEV